MTPRSNPLLPEIFCTLHPPQISATLTLRMEFLGLLAGDVTVRLTTRPSHRRTIEIILLINQNDFRKFLLCSETYPGTSRLAPDGCELVCCGPGYRAGRAEVVQRCSCKFSWCCSVRCQQCKNTVTIHTCRV